MYPVYIYIYATVFGKPLLGENLRHDPDAVVLLTTHTGPPDVRARHEGAVGSELEKVGPPALLEKGDTCEDVICEAAMVQHLGHQACFQGDHIIRLDESAPRHSCRHAEEQPVR